MNEGEEGDQLISMRYRPRLEPACVLTKEDSNHEKSAVNYFWVTALTPTISQARLATGHVTQPTANQFDLVDGRCFQRTYYESRYAAAPGALA